ncbi:unnamed protein product [Musa acuminata subsp. malaccensis]|uniref:(wild Malaysian banana) hypothetical protein n=1 Tax=Musa acuminata subsp. malaccensis TaxID=214687 RepID=A0A804JUF9_MUSAM|nr:PREDICTED: uncharacterized protein LOC103991367 [Musa acuminata subsp. malaccensis]CAG1856227.1 unnamed protein product [Musa acuminata subsp. malaccensis]
MATILPLAPSQFLLFPRRSSLRPPHPSLAKPPHESTLRCFSSSSSFTQAAFPIVTEDEASKEEESSAAAVPPPEEGIRPPDGESLVAGTEDPQFRGCKTCGREEVEKGCNGEGRIQGGIATVPGFGWWPIKAFRPCPGFVATGGRYRRQGQSMDEVAFGRGSREVPTKSMNKPSSSDKGKAAKSLKG